MRYLIGVLIVFLLVPSSAAAEHVCGWVVQYAADFDSASTECALIADAVEEEYPQTYFVVRRSDSRIVDVLPAEEVGDTLIDGNRVLIRRDGYRSDEIVRMFDHEKFQLLTAKLRMMIITSALQTDLSAKSLKSRKDFLLSSEFEADRALYKDHVRALVAIAAVIKDRNPEFLEEYRDLEDTGDLRYWGKWYETTMTMKRREIDESLRRFEIRYGDGSDKLNYLELLIVEFIPPFKGDQTGPSEWEPILRLNPLCYHAVDSRVIKTVPIGINYYFLNGGPFAFLHHVGLSVVLADVENGTSYKWGRTSYGAQIHLGRVQLGLIENAGDESLEMISTVNFQIVPKLF